MEEGLDERGDRKQAAAAAKVAGSRARREDSSIYCRDDADSRDFGSGGTTGADGTAAGNFVPKPPPVATSLLPGIMSGTAHHHHRHNDCWDQRSVATTVDIDSDEAFARALQESLQLSDGGGNGNGNGDADYPPQALFDALEAGDEALARQIERCAEEGQPPERIDEAVNFARRLDELVGNLRAGAAAGTTAPDDGGGVGESNSPAWNRIKSAASAYAVCRLMQAQRAFDQKGKAAASTSEST